MQKIRLKNNVDLFLTGNRINNATYVNVSFVGGWASQSCPQLAHLCEHLIMGNFVINNKRTANKYMGIHNADARTRFDRLEFSFSVLTLAQLKERFSTIAKMINYVDLTQDKLEKEKIIIEEELNTADAFNRQDLNLLISSLKSITIKMVKDYMAKNFIAQNLEIGIVSNLDEKKLKRLIDNFSNSLPHAKRSNKSMKVDFSTKNSELKSTSGEIVKHSSKTTNLEFVLPLKLTKKQELMLNLLTYFNNNFRIGIKKPLRHKSQLAYRTKSGVLQSGNQLVYSVSAMHKEENSKIVEEKLTKWFDRLADVGLTQQEFKLAKFNLEMSKKKLPGVVLPKHVRNMILDYKYNLKKNSDELMWQEVISAQKEDLQNFNAKQNDNYLKMLSRITLPEFNAFLKKILKRQNLQITQSSQQTNEIYKV